ncbi:MAG: M60 family metallopeptidase [Akkermansia sp.]|nr:M60 family metallopeptidase [Akkermansia sp.]
MSIISKAAVLLLAGLAMAAPETPSHGVVAEYWEGLPKGGISALADASKSRKPDAVSIRSRIDADSREKDHYGVRYSALLVPPRSGEYTFYLAADDLAELWLSTDEGTENLTRICEVTSYMPRRHFVEGACSGKVQLKRNKKYYLVVHHVDAIADEHVALAWEGPGIKKGIIPKKHFLLTMDATTRKMWEDTAARESRSKALLQDLLEQKPEQLTVWLNSLSADDSKLLDAALLDAQNSYAAKGTAQFQRRMKPYVKAAAGIVASPASPVSHPVAKRLLYMEEAWLKSLSFKQLLKLGPHRLASSLGHIPNKAKPVSVTQSFNSSGQKWGNEFVSVGLYAIPGTAFTVKLPPELVSKGLQMKVGHHFPEKGRPLVCMPDNSRWFPLNKEVNTFVTPHGGLMLLNVPRKVELRNTPITIEGALKAPRFILGKDTDADWSRLKKAPAPWGELVSDHVVLLVHREGLQKLDNPTEVMTWWDTNTRDMEDFYSYYPQHPFRMHAGYYAEEGISYWPLHWNMGNMEYLLNLQAMKEVNSPYFLHEHGHHCDFWEMELSFWAESTPNWGGYYMKARKGKSFNWKDSHDTHIRNLLNPDDAAMAEIRQDMWYKIDSKGTHHWSYPITSMMIGYAEDFGWDCIKATIKRLRNKEDDMYKWDFVQGADHDQAKIDRYLIGLSEAAKRDVRPYFAHFKLFPSDGASRYLDELRLTPWDLTYLVRPESATIAQDKPLAIPCGKDRLLSFAKHPRIKWKDSSSQGGRVVRQDKGMVIYTPRPGFRGEDVLRYKLFNEHGKTVEKEFVVTVE